MPFYHGQEEASFEWCLIYEAFTVAGARHNDLNFIEGEGRLLEVSAILPDDVLATIGISLATVEERVGNDGIVFFTQWYLTLIGEAWA